MTFRLAKECEKVNYLYVVDDFFDDWLPLDCCRICRHFVALAKKKELSSAVIEILEQLGIVPEKATYVCEMLKEEGQSLYQFSYRIVGNILKERDGDTKEFGKWKRIAVMNHILTVRRDFLHRILIWNFG